MVALLLTLVFGFLAGLHVYWARGGYWPGSDAPTLLSYVVGASPTDDMPSPAACLVVAGLLSVAACIPLALLRWMPMPLPFEWVGLAAYSCAGVLLLRGFYGYVDHRVRPAILGTPFFRLNRIFYSPLCLLLGGLMLYVSSHA